MRLIPGAILHVPADAKESDNIIDQYHLAVISSDRDLGEAIATIRRGSRSFTKSSKAMKRRRPSMASFPTKEVARSGPTSQEPNGTSPLRSKRKSARSRLSKTSPNAEKPPSRTSGSSSTAANQSVIPASNATSMFKTAFSESKAKTKREAVKTPSTFDVSDNPVSTSRTWKPNELCRDSVLTYAGCEKEAGWQHRYRRIQAESGVFEANDILMGVRFVVGL